MVLSSLGESSREEAAKLLADYWKDRGMSRYDAAWAEEYLLEGHKKEIVSDEFFIYSEGSEHMGVIALITYASGVAEVRDMVLKPEHRGKGLGKKMLEELIGITSKRGIRKLYALVFPQYESLYASAGFRKEGVLVDHFTKGEDLLFMGRIL
jgi:N-acetylglutamate synthase-like GNAT family acetyltransferase